MIVVAGANRAVSPPSALTTTFPNPASAVTTLDLTAVAAGDYDVPILRATGQTVLHQTLTAGQPHHLSLTDLPTGTYAVRLRNATTGAGQTLRLVRE